MLSQELLEEANSFMNFIYLQRTWIDQHLDIVARKNKLKLPELKIILCLEFNKEIKTAKDIEKYSDFKRANISILVSSLACRGYLNQVSDENDKRLKKLELTKKCNVFIGECKEMIQKYMNIAFKDISDDEIETLKKIITQMYKNFNGEENGL